MFDFFANPPWYLPIVLALLALVLLFQGNSRQNRNVKYVGLALAVTAAALFALGHYLESDREKAIRLTQEVGAAVDQRQWDQFATYFDPKSSFNQYRGRDEIVAGSRRSVEAADVKNITISGVEVTDEPGGFISNFTATADIGGGTYRLPTNWRFYWSRNDAGNDLVLYRIEYVPNPQLGQDAVLSRLLRP
ncbi:MAG TPA: nuclear transport factor 2 family protein [Tepidisphaeraceae bacterium]|jgi:hypothetical protein